jgi:hypothetical protein
MALIRGTTSKRPCPICFVGAEELSDITGTWTLRTAAHTQEILQQVRGIQGVKGREKLLVEHGIRDVDVSSLFFSCVHALIATPYQNVFWDLHNSDPHRALSFDRLHSNNSGLFGHHLWDQFKALITGFGRTQTAQLDAQ